MPTYTFRNNETGEIFDKMMKISEKETYHNTQHTTQHTTHNTQLAI